MMKTYLRHRICNVIDIKELLALEFLDFEGKYKNYVEAHDFWEICYVIRGEITLVLEETQMTLSEKQLILVPPNKKHSYFSAEGNRNKAFVICFDSFSQALTPISGTLFSPDSVQITCLETIMEEYRTTFRMNEEEQLEVLKAPRFGGQQALMLQLEYLLICLVRRVSVEKNSDIVFCSDENFYGDLANMMLRFLRENVNRKLTLQEICSRFSYSRSFLCKTFKEQTGETLITCFNRLKMEEAERMLAETAETVTNISAALGFAEAKYFDAIFKKHTGLTPAAYRERAAKNNKVTK
jgi:AraC-like DNA-binding protein